MSNPDIDDLVPDEETSRFYDEHMRRVGRAYTIWTFFGPVSEVEPAFGPLCADIASAVRAANLELHALCEIESFLSERFDLGEDACSMHRAFSYGDLLGYQVIYEVPVYRKKEKQ